MKVGYVFDEHSLGHDPGFGHPERPERLEILRPLVEGPEALPGLAEVETRVATHEDLARIHTRSHLERIDATEGESVRLDPDTATSPGSYEAAVRSAGAGLALLDAVSDGGIDTGFALVRPPGHHAEADRAMGFCLYNNVAVAAAYARAVLGHERVMVLDWDVHHGNGTQHVFEHDPAVLYLSSHRYPFYPGTGGLEEVGRGAGKGTTVNVPLPAGAADGELAAVFHRIVRPVVELYRPSSILVSAGFDAHDRDPLGGMHVSTAGFGAMAAELIHAARDLGDTPVVFLLEGGYDLDALRDSVRLVLETLRDEPERPAAPAPSRVEPLLESVRARHRDFEPLAELRGA